MRPPPPSTNPGTGLLFTRPSTIPTHQFVPLEDLPIGFLLQAIGMSLHFGTLFRRTRGVSLHPSLTRVYPLFGILQRAIGVALHSGTPRPRDHMGVSLYSSLKRAKKSVSTLTTKPWGQRDHAHTLPLGSSHHRSHMSQWPKESVSPKHYHLLNSSSPTPRALRYTARTFGLSPRRTIPT